MINFENNIFWLLGGLIIIAAGVVMVLKKYAEIFLELKKKEIELLALRAKPVKDTQPLERMALFLERIKPSYLVGQFDTTLKPAEYVYLLSAKIQQEFEYNISQKIYIRPDIWSKIVLAKDDILDIAQNSLGDLNESLQAYKTRFIMNAIEGDNKITEATTALQNEIK